MGNSSEDSPLLVVVKALVDILAPNDRARLRPWILAKFDVRGYPDRGYTNSRTRYERYVREIRPNTAAMECRRANRRIRTGSRPLPAAL